MKRRLQVFISSTYKDLLLERQAAVSAILKAGHIPAGMELFTAGDRSQMETIKQWIDESDVYMLILGGRYGSVEPESGMGYTELEYDYALEQGKPVFAIVIKDDALERKVKKEGLDFIERDNPKLLKTFRDKVLTNISSFFEDEKDIKLCVYESLADFASKRELRGWVPADAVVDTKPMFDEIAKLAEENRKLKESLAALEQKAAQQKSKAQDLFAELQKVLTAIEITVPASLNKGKEEKADLLNLFYANKETLISGVTNAMNANEAEMFYYTTICPKLQVHGLAINEKVAGVRYRRFAITALGNSFLAYMERNILLKSKDLTKSSVISTPNGTVSDSTQAAKTDTTKTTATKTIKTATKSKKP
ncbi:DUF4062 domain-containing protein [Massilia sp.]|uniref:DUF4062 domain-containing protein n=1 Tax=Massilia sp. TaxID=1882437 RepID=UPI0028A1AA80|nr:DUF4062 domain-containing protein [Massilia sp.]